MRPPAFRAGSLVPLVTSSGVVASVLAKRTAMCSKYQRRKTCLLIVDRDASSSVDDRNYSQNRHQFSTSSLEGSTFIVGSFTERETGP